jgi:Sulfatase
MTVDETDYSAAFGPHSGIAVTQNPFPITAIWSLYSLGILYTFLDYAQNGMNFAHEEFSTTLIWAYLALFILILPITVLAMSWILRKLSLKLDNIFRLSLLLFVGYAALRPITGSFLTPEIACISGILATIGILFLLRTRLGREFFNILKWSILAVPLYFLLLTDMTAFVFPSPPTGIPLKNPLHGPVILVVLDELPAASVLETPETLDKKWLPNLSRFSEHATFYPNTLSHSGATVQSLPTIVSGMMPPLASDTKQCLHRPPVLSLLPQHLYQTFEPSRIRVHERHTRLCPNAECENALYHTNPNGLTEMLSKLFWQEYFPALTTPQFLSLVKPQPEPDFSLPLWTHDRIAIPPKATPMAKDIQFIEELDLEKHPIDLLVYHPLLPHNPFIMTGSGKWYFNGSTLQSVGLRFCNAETIETCLPKPLAQTAYQRHLFQLRATDRLLGQLFDKLKAAKQYDNALIIVTSDHGIDFQDKYPVRDANPESLRAIASVPLWLKLPKQTQGQVNRNIRHLSDITPTIWKALGVPDSRLSILDGRPIQEPAPKEYLEMTYACKETEKLAIDPQTIFCERNQLLAEKHALFGSSSTNPTKRLSHLPEYQTLLGQPEHALTSRIQKHHIRLLSPSSVIIKPSEQTHLPIVSEGVLSDTLHGKKPPKAIAIIVNNRIEGIAQPFQFQLASRQVSKQWLFSALIPEEAFVPGKNIIEAVAFD